MREFQDIIKAFKQIANDGRCSALATVVKTKGSVYRQPGARMLLVEDGQTIGSISGGCLEGDVFERSQPLMFYSGKPVVVQYDTTSSEDIVWGLGLGCNGVVDVLIESLNDASARSQIEFIADCLHQGQPGAIATVFRIEGETRASIASRLLLKPDGTVVDGIEDRQLARRVLEEARRMLGEAQFSTGSATRSQVQSYRLSNGAAEVLIEVIQPLVPLLVFGAGHDAIPVVECAKQLGWHVTVIDHRLGYTTRDRFGLADEIIHSEPENLQAHLIWNPRMVAVVMTHNYLRDRTLLRSLLPSPLGYVGILGPKSRTQRLLQDLQADGFIPTAAQLHRLYSPIGLDIGADAPEAIALAIVAEIQAVLAHRSGGALRERIGSIHSEELIQKAEGRRQKAEGKNMNGALTPLNS
ncbi:XdhC family protein [Phormidium sp. FACHB-592]|uniref:XdhC family protein n=1 Tax=Stenomitos frigidus AS-A4 TaxID=2933935 RepID=A0ABV0KV04_9CYAN|nr:XdhC/CoxI family protein [Phormidium sp. FACHB-592]MBD2076876.1 XdhC family protein [Phormidium sp. FACHB-592]